MYILITGGLGYIGSHVIIKLNELGHNIICIDNLSVEKQAGLRRLDYLKELCEKNFIFFEYDIKNLEVLEQVFQQYPIDGIIHFAAYKSVPESFEKKDEYYENNVKGTVNIINLAKKWNVQKFVFSSSCAVYGDPCYYPVDEKHPLDPKSPYAETKVRGEGSCSTIANYTILRYFNPIGSGASELKDTTKGGIVEALKSGKMTIFGNDYKTSDGTPVRDYIHVEDLACAHIVALDLNGIYNVGTGKGYTVLEVAKAYQKIDNGFLYSFGSRRKGDIGNIYADTKKMDKHFRCEKSLNDMLQSI